MRSSHQKPDKQKESMTLFILFNRPMHLYKKNGCHIYELQNCMPNSKVLADENFPANKWLISQTGNINAFQNTKLQYYIQIEAKLDVLKCVLQLKADKRISNLTMDPAEDLDFALHEYYMNCIGCTCAQICGILLYLYHCNRCIGLTPANFFLYQYLLLK